MSGMNAQGRWFKRMGLRNQKKISDPVKYHGQTWWVNFVAQTEEQAKARIESEQKSNQEFIAKYGIGGLHGMVKKKNFVIRKRRHEQDYGQKVYYDYLVLRRDE